MDPTMTTRWRWQWWHIVVLLFIIIAQLTSSATTTQQQQQEEWEELRGRIGDLVGGGLSCGSGPWARVAYLNESRGRRSGDDTLVPVSEVPPSVVVYPDAAVIHGCSGGYCTSGRGVCQASVESEVEVLFAERDLLQQQQDQIKSSPPSLVRYVFVNASGGGCMCRREGV